MTRKEVRRIENTHPSETVRHHAARHWDALEPLGGISEHQQRAIDRTRRQLDGVLLDYERELLCV